MSFPYQTKESSIHHGEDDLVILIATDNHLGYLEKDAIRSNDSLGKLTNKKTTRRSFLSL